LEQSVLIGYIRLSKADGSQTLDLQRDALLATDVEPGHLYEDRVSGKKLRFVEHQFFAHPSR
jgi:hypothetical protein